MTRWGKGLSEPDIAVSIALGIGLAAATGFRVFLPLLVVGIAGRTGYLPLGEEFAWLSATAALVMLSVAAIVEILAYYVPGLDHLLDMIATPAAVAAGIVVAAAVITDLPPTLKWAVAIIAGGGAAGLTQGGTVLARAHSTAFTAAIGNPVVATVEVGGAIIMSLMSLIAPFIALALLGVLCFITFRVAILKQWRARRRHDG